jgi:hypothetical protein
VILISALRGTYSTSRSSAIRTISRSWSAVIDWEAGLADHEYWFYSMKIGGRTEEPTSVQSERGS